MAEPSQQPFFCWTSSGTTHARNMACIIPTWPLFLHIRLQNVTMSLERSKRSSKSCKISGQFSLNPARWLYSSCTEIPLIADSITMLWSDWSVMCQIVTQRIIRTSASIHMISGPNALEFSENSAGSSATASGSVQPLQSPSCTPSSKHQIFLHSAKIALAESYAMNPPNSPVQACHTLALKKCLKQTKNGVFAEVFWRVTLLWNSWSVLINPRSAFLSFFELVWRERVLLSVLCTIHRFSRKIPQQEYNLQVDAPPLVPPPRKEVYEE